MRKPLNNRSHYYIVAAKDNISNQAIFYKKFSSRRKAKAYYMWSINHLNYGIFTDVTYSLTCLSKTSRSWSKVHTVQLHG